LRSRGTIFFNHTSEGADRVTEVYKNPTSNTVRQDGVETHRKAGRCRWAGDV